jgi:nucleoid DNA-binding protein
MNKRELVVVAARRSSLTQRQMRQAVEALLATIADALAEGDYVALSEFGRLETRMYPGRRLRRFDADGHYLVKDRRVPVFRSSAALRRRVKESET